MGGGFNYNGGYSGGSGYGGSYGGGYSYGASNNPLAFMLFLGDLFYTSKNERERFNVHVKSSTSVYTFKSTVRLKSVSGSGTSTVYAGGGKRQGGNNFSSWINEAKFYLPFYGPCQLSCDAFANGDILNGVGYFGTAVFEVFTLGIGTEISAGARSLNTVSKSSIATSWNQFQRLTKGQFASRAEAGTAWKAYKEASNIGSGIVRSQYQKSLFLRNAANSNLYPKWMNQWLRQGKVPPGYHVDHKIPLSIGGEDLPSNMRLLDIDFHINIHHYYYKPWQ